MTARCEKPPLTEIEWTLEWRICKVQLLWKYSKHEELWKYIWKCCIVKIQQIRRANMVCHREKPYTGWLPNPHFFRGLLIITYWWVKQCQCCELHSHTNPNFNIFALKNQSRDNLIVYLDPHTSQVAEDHFLQHKWEWEKTKYTLKHLASNF